MYFLAYTYRKILGMLLQLTSVMLPYFTVCDASILLPYCFRIAGQAQQAAIRADGLPKLHPCPSTSKSCITPPIFQNGEKSGFGMCFGPSTLGAGAKTRLESRMKKFTPHCIYTLARQPIKSCITPLFFKMACKQNLDLRCVLISDPSTLGAGDKTRLHTPKAVTYHEQPHYCRFVIGHSLGRIESRITKFTLHCICRPAWVAGNLFLVLEPTIKLIIICA